MKRFTKERLLEHIQSATAKLGRKPRLLDLAYFINSELDVNNYDSYDEMSEMIVSEMALKYTVYEYHIQDLIKITKRRTKQEMYEIREAERLEQEREKWKNMDPASLFVL